MSDHQTIAEFSRILRGLLDDDAIILTPETTRADVPGWDSFTYVSFIAAVEQQFHVKFRVADIESFRNVGEIAAATAQAQRRGAGR
jgi:acyl carrier protein